MYRNLEKGFYEIRNTILQSETIRKALYYNDKEALSKDAPSFADVKDYVMVRPIVEIYADSLEKDISSFIAIGIPESRFQNPSVRASYKISSVSERTLWEMDDNRLRPLTMANEIIKLLNGKKLNGVAGKLEFEGFNEVYFNTEMVGYTMFFEVVDEGEGGDLHEF